MGDDTEQAAWERLTADSGRVKAILRAGADPGDPALSAACDQALAALADYAAARGLDVPGVTP